MRQTNDSCDRINTVMKLLVDTGVISEKDVQNMPTSHPNAVLNYLCEHTILIPEDFTDARHALSVLLSGGAPAPYLDAKLTLVNLITKNVHRRIEDQRQKTHAQKERITRESQPQLPKLQKTIQKSKASKVNDA